MTVGEPFLSGRTMVLAGHLDRYVVAYPISSSHERQGRALTNFDRTLPPARIAAG